MHLATDIKIVVHGLSSATPERLPYLRRLFSLVFTAESLDELTRLEQVCSPDPEYLHALIRMRRHELEIELVKDLRAHDPQALDPDLYWV